MHPRPASIPNIPLAGCPCHPFYRTQREGKNSFIPHLRLDNFMTFLALGLGAAAPIGPVNVEIARRTLRGGFWPGLTLGAGAVTVDCLYSLLSSQSLGPIVNRPAVKWTFAIAGFILLVYLGAMSLC